MDDIRSMLDAAVEHHRLSRLPEAEQLYRRVLAIEPNHAEAIHCLGTLAVQTGHVEAGLGLIDRSLKLQPNVPVLYLNAGLLLRQIGRSADAVQAIRRAIALGDSTPMTQLHLAGVFGDAGDAAEAEKILRGLIAQLPAFAEAYSDLGLLLVQEGHFIDGIEQYRTAIRLRPQLPTPHFNLSYALSVTGELAEAFNELRTTLQLKPDFVEARLNLGNMLLEAGDIDAAIAEYRAVQKIDPKFPGAQPNLLLAMHCDPRTTPQELFEEHVNYGRQFADGIPRMPPGTVDKNPERKLRIGYFSPDFREHAVASFITPVLEQHDRVHFEVVCYASTLRPDGVTENIRAKADQWRDITRLNDQQFAEQVRQDQIDILIDLAGHTNAMRLPAFARKPAPVQVTWLGYPDTTGMSAMDYRITDAITDPLGDADARHVERVIRLPGCFICFAPFAEPLDSGPLPALANGFVTFGCFNRMAKVSGMTMDLWAKVLDAVPNSKLMLKGGGLAPSSFDSWLKRLAEHGIDPSRVIPLPASPTKREHLIEMQSVDIALDTFPYNATTVTCEWLWSGVPAVTLTGQTHASRVGLSLLTAVGIPEYATTTPAQYVQTATQLANDLPRLGELRSTLCTRLLTSPLTDASAFTRNLESAYRQMWQRFCAG